jgi:hypothetical protein
MKDSATDAKVKAQRCEFIVGPVSAGRGEATRCKPPQGGPMRGWAA